MLNLVNRENWRLILGERRTVIYKNGTSPTNDKYRYEAIDPIYVLPNSNILLVGSQSNSAKKYWYLGARISQYLYVSPSSNANFIRGVEAQEQRRIRLNNLTLVSFKDYGIYPYVLAIEIPYWLEDAYVEVWEYNQVISDSVQLVNIEGLYQRLERIEDKINHLSINPQQTQSSINFSTGFNDSDSSGSLGII